MLTDNRSIDLLGVPLEIDDRLEQDPGNRPSLLGGGVQKVRSFVNLTGKSGCTGPSVLTVPVESKL